MNDDSQKRPNVADSAELRELFGPPPVLSTENAKGYDEIVARLMECLVPQDFLEQLLIKQYADYTWEKMRYARHKPWAVERKFHQIREFQAKRAKAAAQKREPQARDLSQGDCKPTNDFERMFELEDVVDSGVPDIDEILNRPPVELDHARALEATIVYQGQLDQLDNSAGAKQNDTLAQLERYRTGLGTRHLDWIFHPELNRPRSK
jgi:hypothetical protein